MVCLGFYPFSIALSRNVEIKNHFESLVKKLAKREGGRGQLFPPPYFSFWKEDNFRTITNVQEGVGVPDLFEEREKS